MPEYHGRVNITWPAPSNIPDMVMAWGVTIHDADTGEQLVTVTALKLHIGDADGWHNDPVAVTLTQLVDADGQPLGTGKPVVPTDEYLEHRNTEKALKTDLPFTGETLRTGEFRYLVAEMRTAPAAVDA